MRTLLTSAATLLALTSAAFAQDIDIGPAPDWVKALADNGEVEPSGQAVTVLSVDYQYHYGGAAETFVETRMRVETLEGLQIGNVSLSWVPATSALTVHGLTIERDGKTIDVLANGQTFRVIDAEPQYGQAMLHGTKIATLPVEGLRVGDTLVTSYTMTTDDPVVGGRPNVLMARPDFGDIEHARLRYSWDESQSIRWRITGEMDEPVALDKSGRDIAFTFVDEDAPDADEASGETDKEDADADEGRYEKVPAAAPRRYWLSPRFELTAFDGWSDVSRLFTTAYDDAATIEKGSELAGEVRRIKRATRDPVERADLALDLVQDQVRYLFSALDAGGYQPANAEEVWDKRFGDCKGKTVLLVALLRELGIDAVPAVVSTGLGDALPGFLPSHGVFDHVVVRAEIDGRTYWLDGTQSEATMAGSDLSGLRWALPLTERTTALEEITAPPTDGPIRRVALTVDASEGLDGDLPFTMEQTVVGPLAQPVRAAMALGADQRKGALSFLFQDLDARLSADDVKVDAAVGEGDAMIVTANGTLTLRAYGMAGHDGFLVPLGVLAASPWELVSAKADREAPFALGEPGSQAVTTTVTLPEGERFYLAGENADMTGPGLSFTRETVLDDGTLRMTAAWRSDRREVGMAESARTAALFGRASNAPPMIYEAPEQNGWPSSSGAPDKPSADDEEIDDDDASGFYHRGGVAFAEARWADAIADYDRSLALEPYKTFAKADRGMAKLWKGDREDAAKDFRAVLEADPQHPIALHGLGHIALAEERPAEAAAFFARSVAISPSNDFARASLASALAEDGQTDRALAEAEWLIAKYPREIEYLGLKAGILVDAGKAAGALSLIDAEIAAEPAAVLYQARAHINEEAGNDDAALADLNEAIAFDRRDAFGWNQRCWFRATNDRELSEALNDCEQALRLRPGEAAFLDSRGLVHLRRGDLDLAEADYDAALAKSPGMAASLYGRGHVHRLRGDEKAAIADFEAAREASPKIEEEFTDYGLAANEGR